MRWKRYGITMDFTGISKKHTAQIVADQFGKDFQFDSVKDTYIILDQFDRRWEIKTAQGIDAEKIQGTKKIRTGYIFQVKMHTPLLYENDFDKLAKILVKMKEEGVLVNQTTKMEVQIEATDLKNKYLENLERVGTSKRELLAKALGGSYSFLADASMRDIEGIVTFPLFYSSVEPEIVKSNIQLAQGIHQFANRDTAISEKVNPSANDKFVFRTWMIRLGMIGDEFKFARKLFTQDLYGNSAWLRRIEVSEVDEQFHEEQPQMIQEEFQGAEEQPAEEQPQKKAMSEAEEEFKMGLF